MTKQLDLPVFWNGIKRYRSYAPLVSAAALLLLGAGVMFGLPDSNRQSNKTTATTASVGTTGSASAAETSEVDDSACDKQAWPYVDQRCAQRIEKARDTRQVRIVTDKGNSVTVTTPVPVVEAKPKPTATPVVAQVERKMGPAAVPPAPEGSPPIEQTASVAQPPAPAPAPKSAPIIAEAKPSVAEAKPTVQAAVATTDPQPKKAFARTPVPPAASSETPVSAGGAAIDEARPKKSKTERAAEKRDSKREAKRRKMMDDANGVPEDVVATVKSLKNNRKSAQDVPDEVISAVEAATGRDISSRRGHVVYIERGW